jgi:EpsI family protein
MAEADLTGNRRGVQLSRRHFVMGTALLATSGLAYARQPSVHNPVVKPDVFENWVPARVGQWSVRASSGVVLPPPDALSDRLYDNLVTRVYTAPDSAVMLLLAYNNTQDGVLQVHRPEICYPVGGYVLTETQRISVPALGREVPANVFTATGPDRVEQVVYFTRLGGAYPRSWIEQRVAVVEENLGGRIPDGALLRASVLSTDRDDSVDILRNFIEGFVAAAAPSLQRLLVV